jgi:hypothetical protein
MLRLCIIKLHNRNFICKSSLEFSSESSTVRKCLCSLIKPEAKLLYSVAVCHSDYMQIIIS